MFDGRRFVNIASYLGMRRPIDAAFDRAAIGRYYYAAFLVVRDYAITHGQSFTSDSVHSQVIKYIRNHSGLPAPQRNDLANTLNQLRRRRVQADYIADFGDCRKTCEEARRLADKILRAF